MNDSVGVRFIFAVLVALLLTSGCATYQPGLSDTAQTADTVTTAIGLYGSTAAVEANPALAPLVSSPAGLVAVGLLKVGVMHGARQLENKDCERVIAVGTAAGFGAAANNLVVILGGATMVAIGGGLSVALATYHWSKQHNALSECGPARERRDSMVADAPENPIPL